MNMRRIVVTGMGVVSPLGCGTACAWERLLAGCSGVRALPDAMRADLQVHAAGQVPSIEDDAEGGFDPARVAAPKELRKMDTFIQYALMAADEALAQANWAPRTDDEQQRSATIIASGVGGFPLIVDSVRTVDERGTRRLSPFTVPGFLVNLAAGHVSIRHQFKGPIGAPVTACAAGVQAIGDAARLIHCGEADIAVCGGAEACIDTVSLGGFAAARALSTAFPDAPEKASRPFDRDRDGFVMGEGAGVLVIETLEHALERGATPLAELVGYGTSADAYHLTAGAPDGSGAINAMQRAIRQAGIRPDQIGHLNAHATSTQVGDAGELAAIHHVFGGDSHVAVSSTKSSTGHLLGAAGGLEAVFTVQALRHQIAPATLNLEHPDEQAAGIDLVRGEPRALECEYAISNGFGFGGVNASVIFKRWAG
ncbi:beta-ketoacyl-ACP synthase II [Zymobacter palmae]|nr:beta-ketoacyl-ACP synthase II [Zymobacter palmae]